MFCSLKLDLYHAALKEGLYHAALEERVVSPN